MLIDSRQLDEGTQLDSAVCVIGGGPAGITLALELAKQGIEVNLFESGPLQLHEPSLDLNDGESVGLPYEFGYGHRSRFLGGGSNCWGGFCRPWDRWDFEKRAWVANSGWPFSMDTIAPYYRRAHKILQVPSENFDAAFWHQAADGQLNGFALDAEKIQESITLFSPPLKFGKEYRDELSASKLIRVYLWANVVHIDSAPISGQVTRVEFRTLSGRRFFAQAKEYVLAAGGIENSRILLNSNRQQSAGLGNANDMVGRYFMDHPRLISGEVKLAPKYRRSPVYDAKFFCISDTVEVNGVRIAAQFALPLATQRSEGLLNSQLWLRSLYPGETLEAIQSLFRMRLRAARRYAISHRLGHDLKELARHPLAVALFAAAHVTKSQAMVQRVVMEAIVEPEPLADSRVLLSSDHDALGMRRAKIDWRLSEQVKRTFDRGFEVFGTQLQQQGIAQVELGPKFEGRDWPERMTGTWHHMGGTRMHDSPRSGVVDRNCRVHGVNNLHIAGSSVFPTGSSNYPTVTLVALAIRLSERLAYELRKPSSPSRTSARVPVHDQHPS